MFHGVYLIYKNEGPLALYKGSFARIAMFTPSTAISMGLTETIRSYLINKI